MVTDTKLFDSDFGGGNSGSLPRWFDHAAGARSVYALAMLLTKPPPCLSALVANGSLIVHRVGEST
jgi:hypothetical protein